MSRFEPTFKAELWRFLLLRTIHDLGNSVSGILTLSAHHVRHELPIEEITESFKLIQESAESAREMLITVGSLVDDESQGPEPVRVSDFLKDLLRQLSRIVPRSVSLQLDGELSDAIIEIDSCHLRQAYVALVAASCLAFGAKPGSIQFAAEAEAGKIWMVYSASHRADSDLVRQAAEIFGNVNPPPDELAWSETDQELRLRIGYSPAAGFTIEPTSSTRAS